MPIATPPAERAGGGSGAARLLLAGLMLAYALAALASGMERMAAQRAGPPADLATARAGFSAQPLSALAAGALAAAEWRAGNGAMAERVFRHAAQLGWREPATQLYWLQVAAAAGQWGNAAKRYDALLRVDPRRAALAELAAPLEGAGAGRTSLARRIALRPHWLADYADLAAEREGAVRPGAAAHVPVGRNDAARHGQRQRHGQVGHVVGQDVRRMGDRDAALARRRDIDPVVADTEYRDDFGRGKAGHHLAGQDGFAVGDECARLRRELFQSRRIVPVQFVMEIEARAKLLGQEIRQVVDG